MCFGGSTAPSAPPPPPPAAPPPAEVTAPRAAPLLKTGSDKKKTGVSPEGRRGNQTSLRIEVPEDNLLSAPAATTAPRVSGGF